jgi:HK97 family phage major capsid protein
MTANLNTPASVAQLLTERERTYERCQRILDRAAREGRGDLLASEARTFDREESELKRLDAVIDELPRHLVNAARSHIIDESRRRAGVPLNLGDPIPEMRTENILADLSSGRTLDLPVGDLLAAKRTASDGRLERRDIVTTSAGAPVPVQTSSTIYEYLVEGSGVLRSNVNILNTPSGASFRLPKFTSYSSAAQYAEAAAISEADPTLATVTFGAYKFATLTTWSSELQEDVDLNLGEYLAKNLATALSETYGPQLIDGDGTTEPQGIITGITTGATSGTGVAGVPTANNLLDLFFSLAPQYRTNACWIMKDSTLAAISKLVDGESRYLLTPSLSADVPATILGRPVFTDPSMPATGTTRKSIVFADMSRYMTVRFAGSLRIELDRSAQFEQDMVVMRAVQRLDSKVVDTNAGRAFVGAAS